MPPARPTTVTLLPVELPRDADAILALVRAHDAVWLQGQGSPAEQTLDDIARVARDDVGTTTVSVDAAGDVTGLVFVEAVFPENENGWIDVYVHPDRCGSAEDALVAHGVDTVRTWPGTPRTKVETGTVHGETELADTLTRNGFTHERSFYRMVLDLGPQHAQVPPPPPGVVVRRLPDTQRSRAVLHHVCETSFRDHWNHDERTLDQFWARKEESLGFDPTQWWVAELDGVPVGALICDNAKEPDGVGYVQTLGVLREARGRGVARHLLRTVFADHLARGLRSTSLGVDTASPTGATALYRSVGMRETVSFDAYVLALT